MKDDTQKQQKRSFTVPVLLIIIVTLAILCILFYSKQLLSQQVDKTDEGKALAQKYAYAQSYADLLRGGAKQMLDATSEADRMRAKELLGEARFAFAASVSLFVEALIRQTGLPDEQAMASLAPMTTALGGAESVLNTVGEHEGPLTDAEKAALSAAVDAGTKAGAALSKYHAPTGDGAYRIMADGGEWIDAALQAKLELEALAKNVS